MLYNVVLVSAVQHESAICIHISPPSQASLSPYPHPTLPGPHRVQSRAPCVNSSFSLAIYFIQGTVYMLMLVLLNKISETVIYFHFHTCSQHPSFYWLHNLKPPCSKNTGVGSLSLLQQIFPTQESTWSPALQVDSLPTELWGKPSNLYHLKIKSLDS